MLSSLYKKSILSPDKAQEAENEIKQNFAAHPEKKIIKMTTENEKIPSYANTGLPIWGWWGKRLHSCQILKGTAEEYGGHFPQYVSALEL